MGSAERESRRESNRKWWAANAARILEQRKKKYVEDPLYRKEIKERSLLSWKIKQKEGSKRRKLRLQRDRDKVKKLSNRKQTPRIITVNNLQIKVLSIGYLASELGVQVNSIRRWIRLKALPNPTFVDNKNRSWFSEEYIATLKKVFIDVKSRNWSLSNFKEELKSVLPNASW